MPRTFAGAVATQQELLNAEDVARILGTTVPAIRVAIAEERTHLIPPSFTLGRRRVWLRREVLRWLNREARRKHRVLSEEQSK